MRDAVATTKPTKQEAPQGISQNLAGLVSPPVLLSMAAYLPFFRSHHWSSLASAMFSYVDAALTWEDLAWSVSTHFFFPLTLHSISLL